jgi:hypothetical protein
MQFYLLLTLDTCISSELLNKLRNTSCMSGWLVGWLVYSCCSHLEHTASLKHFVLLLFLNQRHSVGFLGRVISPSQGRYLTQTQNKQKQTPMLRVGFEPTIPVFERAKTVHALDRARGHCDRLLYEWTT